jgi:hypothetical protein
VAESSPLSKSELNLLNFTYNISFGAQSYERKQEFRFIDVNNKIVAQRNTVLISPINVEEGIEYLGMIIFIVIFMLSLSCRVENKYVYDSNKERINEALINAERV